MADKLIKIALLVAVAYGAWYWYGMESGGSGSTAHAESACREAIGSRFDISRVTIFEVTENRNGYTVRASGSLDDGKTARLVCLTSQNGTVRDVTIEHR